MALMTDMDIGSRQGSSIPLNTWMQRQHIYLQVVTQLTRAGMPIVLVLPVD